MDSLLEWLSKNFLSLFTLIFTPILSYYISRRKYESEVRQVDVNADSKVVDSAKSVVSMWEEMSNKLKAEQVKTLSDLESRISKLENCERENEILQGQIETLIKMNKELSDYNSRLLVAIRLIIIEISKTNPELAEKVKVMLGNLRIED